ncbi:hypothetical protein GCM10010231_65940 [Streptomyces sindenensis]|nr:hypothetical protein GCM10010231_65940 [Streptomyces sindenensis]
MAKRHVYAVADPATGKLVQEYPTATDEVVDAALDAAAGAYARWSRQTSVEERARFLHAVATLHSERSQHLAEIIHREMGKSVDEAVGEVEFSASIYRYYAENAETFLTDEPIELLEGQGTAVVRRRPVGVLLGVMPWNHPYYQVARFAAPNLALGNTIVLKHASQCPESSAATPRRIPRPPRSGRAGPGAATGPGCTCRTSRSTRWRCSPCGSWGPRHWDSTRCTGAGSSAASSSIPGRSGSSVRTRRSMRRSGRRRGAQCVG